MRLFIAAIASLALGACTFAASGGSDDAPHQAPVTLTASGEPAQLEAEPQEDNMQWAASVTDVDFLQNQEGSAGVKLFGLAGGDPAMNGLYTQIAFFQGPSDGWRVFRLGDFLNYRVLSDSPGRVDLEIEESTMGDDGVIGARTRHVIVTWTQSAEGEAPETITVTPAEAP